MLHTAGSFHVFGVQVVSQKIPTLSRVVIFGAYLANLRPNLPPMNKATNTWTPDPPENCQLKVKNCEKKLDILKKVDG